jgi:hypothetical protein
LHAKNETEFSSQSKEVENRYAFSGYFLRAGFIPYLPEYDAGVDLILYRERDDLLLKVQLKARWSVDRKYFGRDIWMAFPDRVYDQETAWYLVPHDLMVVHAQAKHSKSESWQRGAYSKPYLTRDLAEACSEFRVPAILDSISKSRIERWAASRASSW